MTAKIKKQKKTKLFQADPEFVAQWTDSQIDLSKSSTKLLKLFQQKSGLGASYPCSPLSWFVDESAEGDAAEKIDFWHQQLLGQIELREHFVDICSSVEQLTDLPYKNEASADAPSGATAGELGVGDALIAIGACHSLRAIAGYGPLMEWNGLVTRLLEIASVAESNVALPPCVYQLLAIEVPLTIAFQIREIEDHQQLAVRCAKRFEVSIEDKVDLDGWPQARYLSEFGLLASSWVRCGLMLRKMNIELDSDASSQLGWVGRQLLRVVGADGRLLFSGGRQRPMVADLVSCLMKLSSDDKDKNILKLRRSRPENGEETKKAESKKSKAKKGKKDNSKKLPRVSCISEWGESGALRSHWGLDSPLVGFDYCSRTIHMSVARSESLITGLGMPEISLNSVPVVPVADFEVVCEQSDKDVEYVELETDLGEGAVFNRQILLSRDEEFLLIADVVVPKEKSRIDYRCQYRLAPEIVGMQETENREVYLRTNEIQSLVLPLALPEWKVANSSDSLEFDASKLTLKQSIEGCGLYAPLFFDLNPERSRKKRTWRQLTVGENLEVVPRDVAVAYRVQLDEQQWCFYRAISSQGNRTFLGENIIGEFVFNRFKQDGTVIPLLKI